MRFFLFVFFITHKASSQINPLILAVCGESKILFQFINPINVRLSGRDIDCGF